MTTQSAATSKPRVLVDFKQNGAFFIYSDEQAQVIVRCAHSPEDELYRYGHRPIPEEWLEGKPVGYKGDGSGKDECIERFLEAFKEARGV